MPRVTSIDYPEAEALTRATLAQGDLIVLPTDTVYGIGTQIMEPAIARIFAVKRRPPDRAVPVLVADADAVSLVATAFPAPLRQLAAAFWPGPLTIVLPKRDDLPSNLSLLPTVGVRVPAHPRACEVIAAAGGALAVTSANFSDQPAACTIQDAIRYFKDNVALYLDGGTCSGGVPSTVVSLGPDGAPVILREGPIDAATLHAALA